MSDIKVLWIDLNFIINYFFIIFKNFINLFTLKKKHFFFNVNKFYYYFFFKILKFNSILKTNSLSDIISIHYPGELYEFELIYIFISYKLNFRFFFKLFFKKEDLILSLNKLFKSASWLEREVWDLFGLKFIYHNDLRRILTDYGFIGHPLLKQFPLLGYIELRYDDNIHNIIKEPIEITQMYRFFKFINPWNFWKG